MGWIRPPTAMCSLCTKTGSWEPGTLPPCTCWDRVPAGLASRSPTCHVLGPEPQGLMPSSSGLRALGPGHSMGSEIREQGNKATAHPITKFPDLWGIVAHGPEVQHSWINTIGNIWLELVNLIRAPHRAPHSPFEGIPRHLQVQRPLVENHYFNATSSWALQRWDPEGYEDRARARPPKPGLFSQLRQSSSGGQRK